MKQNRLFSFLSLLLAALWMPALQAAPFYTQSLVTAPASQLNSFDVSSMYYDPATGDSWTLASDAQITVAFLLTANASLHSIDWFGTAGHSGGFFDVVLKNSASNILNTRVNTADATQTATSVNGIYQFHYNLTSDKSLSQNIGYSLSILEHCQACSTDSSNWKWALGVLPATHPLHTAVQFQNSLNTTIASSDRAFTLNNSSALASVPLPSAFWMLITGLLGMFASSRQRRVF